MFPSKIQIRAGAPSIMAEPKKATRRVLVKERDVSMPNIKFEPIYRVLLHPTEHYNDRELINKICINVPPVSAIEAKRAVDHANSIGVGIIITCHINDAIMYLTRLQNMLIQARIEEA